MVRFWSEYPEFSEIGARAVRQIAAEASHARSLDGQKISAPPVRQLPDRTVDLPDEVVFLQLSWSHNIVLMQQIKDLPTRLWYARQTLEQGWTRDTLTAQIKSGAHQRQGTAINNFNDRLQSVHARLASGLLKDPYLFDFVTMEEQCPFRRRA